MRRLFAALVLTTALALVGPIAVHAQVECLPGTGNGDVPCIPFEQPPVPQLPTSMTITVTKVLTGDVQGPLSAADFPLFVDGASVTSGQPQTFSYASHTVTETQQPNYSFVGFSGDCNSDGVIATTQSGFASCTVTNSYTPPGPGTVTVHKIVVNSASGTATVNDFAFNIGEQRIKLDEPVTLDPGSYTVTEQGPFESDQVYYASYSPSCPNGTFTVVSGQNVDCTITNSDTPPAPPIGGGGGHPKPPATITVITNVTNDQGGTAGPSDFTATVTAGGTPMSLTGADGFGASMTIAPGDFSVTPGTNAGYAWSTSGQCDGTLAQGASATCTIDYADTGDTPPFIVDSGTTTDIVPPDDSFTPTDDGTSTPPVDVTPPPDFVPPPSHPPAPPKPRVLGATDVGAALVVSASEPPPVVDSATAPVVTPTSSNGAGCSWFWGWLGCYWWILLLLIVIALLAKSWQKMNDKDTVNK